MISKDAFIRFVIDRLTVVDSSVESSDGRVDKERKRQNCLVGWTTGSVVTGDTRETKDKKTKKKDQRNEQLRPEERGRNQETRGREERGLQVPQAEKMSYFQSRNNIEDDQPKIWREGRLKTDKWEKGCTVESGEWRRDRWRWSGSNWKRIRKKEKSKKEDEERWLG